jgi:hypothetical protein
MPPSTTSSHPGPFWQRLTLLGTLLVAAAGPAAANDFPTNERVLWVQECMRDHPGNAFEMISKCSCALDRIAAEVKFDEYLTMSTAAKANSIGGDRGGYIRDTDMLQKEIRRFRDLQTKAKSACFINTGPR